MKDKLLNNSDDKTNLIIKGGVQKEKTQIVDISTLILETSAVSNNNNTNQNNILSQNNQTNTSKDDNNDQQAINKNMKFTNQSVANQNNIIVKQKSQSSQQSSRRQSQRQKQQENTPDKDIKDLDIIEEDSEKKSFQQKMEKCFKETFYNMVASITLRIGCPLLLAVTFGTIFNITGFYIYTDYVTQVVSWDYLNYQKIHLRSRSRASSMIATNLLQNQINIQRYLIRQNDYENLKNYDFNYYKKANKLNNNYLYNGLEFQRQQNNTNEINNQFVSIWYFNNTLVQFQDLTTLQQNAISSLSSLDSKVQLLINLNKIQNAYIILQNGIYYQFTKLFQNDFENFSPLLDDSYLLTINNYINKNQSMTTYQKEIGGRIKYGVCSIMKNFLTDQCKDNFCGVFCSVGEITNIYQYYLKFSQINYTEYKQYLTDIFDHKLYFYEKSNAWDQNSSLSNQFNFKYSSSDTLQKILFQQNDWDNGKAKSFHDFFKPLLNEDQVKKTYQNSVYKQSIVNQREFIKDLNNSWVVSINQLCLKFYENADEQNNWPKMIQVNYFIKEQIQEQLYFVLFEVKKKISIMIGILISLLVINFYASYKVVQTSTNAIVEPLNDLLNKVKQVENEDLGVKITDPATFKKSSLELNELYEDFEILNIILRFGNNKFFQDQNDDIALMNYQQALLIHQQKKNKKGMGIALNNSGNIHMKNNRMKEAVECYKQAVMITEKQLCNLFKSQSLFIVYKVKPLMGWDNIKDLDGKKINKDQKSIDQNKQVMINTINKQAFEKIFVTRCINFCESLVVRAKSKKDKDKKIDFLIFIIDLLRLVKKIDTQIGLGRSREIRTSIKICDAYLEICSVLRKYNDQYIAVLWKFDSQIQEDQMKKLNQFGNISNNQNKNQMVLEQKIQGLKQQRDQELNKLNQNQDNLQKYFDEALEYIEKGHLELKNYSNVYKLFKNEDMPDTPPEILNQYLLMQQGLFFKQMDRYKDSMDYLISCMKHGYIYHPQIRKICLENVKEILKIQIDNIIKSEGYLEQKESSLGKINKFSKVVDNIQDQLDVQNIQKNKDIVFVLDWSESMDHGGRKQHSLVTFVDLLNKYMIFEDRISFVRFNQNVYVEFDLQKLLSEQNSIFLQNHISQFQHQPCSGGSAIFDAINASIKILQRADKCNHNQWIVVLTDGEDNCSQISKELLQNKLKQSNFGIIIIGIALSQFAIKQLKQVCDHSIQGLFIQSVLSNDLSVAFKAMSNLIFQTNWNENNLVYENFD